MRRAHTDTALAFGLGTLWLVCLGLHVELLALGRVAWFTVYVAPAETPSAHPRVDGHWPELGASHEGLRTGDRILALAGEPMAGAGRLETFVRAYRGADPRLRVALQVEREGTRREVGLFLAPVRSPWRTLPVVLGLGATGLIVLLRGRVTRVARAYGVGALAFALHWSIVFGQRPWQTALGIGAFFVGGALFQPLFLRAALLFPPGTEPRTRVGLAWPWLFLLLGPALTSWVFGVPFGGEVGLRLVFALNLLFVVSLLAIYVAHYRRADGLGRRQLRWILWGAFVGLAPVAAGAALAVLDPARIRVYEASLAATVILPLCVLIAIARTHVLDIDRLISSTAAYSVLLIAALAAALTLLPSLGAALGRVAGISQVGAQVGISVALAALVVPLERRMRGPIERLFFREREHLARGAGELAASLEAVSEPGQLVGTLGERLVALLRLDRCSIYARTGSAFAPVFAHGAPLPPGFDADAPLMLLLEDAAAPIDRARWRRWARGRLLSPAGRAALESLDATVLLPVLRGESLAAIVCLGEKGSGDLYTPTDLAHLARVGEAASARMGRFDLESIEREQRARYERVARYVPTPLVEEVERGAAIATGLLEVSILFVDIRGYTSFSEGRSADEIFRLVNEYTTAVSAVVRECGGTVIQFHGDGLLAVWGAPRRVEHAERASVMAAVRIVETVEAAGLRAAGDVALQVGVGIATGEAYVGDIESVDQKLWSVIGNPVNLSARLQALAPSVDATVVIDAGTFGAAGAAAAAFVETPEVRIKGLADPVTVYRLERAGVG